MLIKKIFSIPVFIGLMMFFSLSTSVWADEPAPAGDESATFTTTNAPDALIILDLSGSMSDNPAGISDYIYGNSSCAASTSCVCTP
jgi:hypothetical protein